MRTLTPPEVVPIDLYDMIVQAKRDPRRSLLTALRDRMVIAYEAYAVERVPALEPITVDELERETMLHCYVQQSRPLAQLRDTLLRLNEDLICPYCGIDHASTLDHYLPKERFPEYSVFALNLVKACARCNAAKGSTYLDQGRRVFLHVYYDRVPSDEMSLETTIRWGKDGTPLFLFDVRAAQGADAELYALVRRHVGQLGLLRWYTQHAPEEFTGGVEFIHRSASLQQIAEIARDRCEARRTRESALSWKAALWAAVAADDRALELMQRMVTLR